MLKVKNPFPIRVYVCEMCDERLVVWAWSEKHTNRKIKQAGWRLLYIGWKGVLGRYVYCPVCRKGLARGIAVWYTVR